MVMYKGKDNRRCRNEKTGLGRGNGTRINKFCREEKYDELVEYLMKAVNNLVQGGADFAALSANTPHIVFKRLQEKSTVPLVSIIEATRDEAIRLGLHKLGLLGTVFTMTGDFFKEPFYGSGIEIITPAVEEMEFVNFTASVK